jgi:predicted lipoprotein with Yx(FWY)xxD motif
MRKSRWAVAVGLGSLALLLTACGSSASPTAGSTSAPQSSAASSSSAGQSSTSAASSSPATAPSSANPGTSAPASHSAAPLPVASGGGTIPLGTTIMIVQQSKVGYVLALANGQVVYTYTHDTKGGTPTCTGSCSDTWVPVTGVPKAALGVTFPGTFGLVVRSDGAKQVTYNGYPLYTFKGAFPLTVHLVAGVWKVIPLSSADLG